MKAYVTFIESPVPEFDGDGRHEYWALPREGSTEIYLFPKQGMKFYTVRKGEDKGMILQKGRLRDGRHYDGELYGGPTYTYPRTFIAELGYTPLNLASLMESFEMTVADVAELLDVCADTVSRWRAPSNMKRHADMPLSKWQQFINFLTID